MKFSLQLLSLIFFILSTANAQISGTVFRDFNANGIKGAAVPNLEPGINGIIVNAYNASNTLIASFTTNSTGIYSIPVSGAVFSGTQGSNTGFVSAGLAVRIEFTIPTSGSCGISASDFSSFNGTGNGTSVQFASGGATNINYAISNPEDYTINTNPDVFIPQFINGDPTIAGTSQTNIWFKGFPYNTIGTTASTKTLNGATIGSVWGVAYSKQARKIFTSAFLKRHCGFGTLGSGGIYILTPTATSFTAAAFYNMDVNGHRTRASAGTYGSGNSYNLVGSTSITFLGAVDALTGQPNGLGVVGTNANRGLGASATAQNNDPAAFDQTCKVGLGDIEISDDGKFLFVMNLYSRLLFRLELNDAYNPTSVVAVTSYALPAIAVTNGVMRPFALKYNKGKVFVGALASGENAGVNTIGGTTNMFAYVFELNDPKGAASFNVTPVITFPLNHARGQSWDAFTATTNRWYPWSKTTTLPFGGATNKSYPTPLLSNIEFSDNGAMILDFCDRSGHQYGNWNYRDLSGTATASIFVGGELLAAGKNCGTGIYSLESNGSFNSEGVAFTSSTGVGRPGPATINGTGTGYTGTAGEFFNWDDAQLQGDNNDHSEGMQGGAAVLRGDAKVFTTHMDPIVFNTGGTSKHSTTNGVGSSGYQMYVSSGASIDPFFNKGNGLGDVELLTDVQPIQIGNRIWLDTNSDGIQDAGETTAAVPTGTTVTLRSPGLDGDYITAGDNQTWTTTTDANGNYYFSALAGGDNRKPATWASIGNTILPGYDYRVEIAVPSGFQLTKSNTAGNTFDKIDNDATLNAANAIVTFNTGNTNHNFDIGFKALASLGDKVWRDDNKDGIQNIGEPGVAGVTVTLYKNGTDGLPCTVDDIIVGTTVTDAYGMYLFDNLTPSTNAATQYNAGFTPPANYQFTTQTNTQVIGTSDVTNTTTTTGGSTAANGSDANITTGCTGSFWLAPGENETGVDAGIIFSQPTTNSIGDRVWFDTNNDGLQTAGEASVSGVTVTLCNNAAIVIATTVTDANGNYIFTNLPDGNYKVGFTLPSGMNFTTKGGDNTSGGAGDSNTDSDVNTSGINFGKTDLIDLDAAGSNSNGVNYTNVDAGLVIQPAAKASLGDKVWNDLNDDGIQDADEPGVSGVTVTLYAADGVTVVATTVTDAFGNYIFNNLDAGGYIVAFGTAAGFIRSTNQNTGSNDFVDNDANPATGRTVIYNLVAGQRNLSVDAALVSSSPNTARLGDYVWFDANKDGVQDAAETPVAGVTATLYNSSGTAIGTTATDANGYYQFTNLAAGNYSVGFSNLPAGYSFTTSTGTTAGSATTNSDADLATGRTAQITLNAGESLQGLDAGLIAGVSSGLGSLGNKIWWDLDGDNVQDTDEPGVGGVTVTLLDYGPDGVLGGGDDGPSKTTTTNALGEYIFTGLLAGNYAVQFGTGSTLPAGATAVTQNSGADDTIDSDGAAISGGTSTTAVYKLAAGEDNLTVDLGISNTAKGSFGNRVWYDNGTGGGTANDGIQNGTEIGVAGVMVTLVNAVGQTIDRTGTITTSPILTTTDANGYYAFADLTPGGAFAAKFSNLPAGFDFTTKAGAGSGDDNRSDANLITGLTPTVTIIVNTFNPTLDAGINSTRAALGNYVWLDDNGDGIQDLSEPSVPGVTVTLYRPGFGLDSIAGNADDALAVANMITDQNGKYLFDNLILGTYEVEFNTIPGGLSFTKQNTPGDNGDNTNSDANPATGRTASITLTAGEVDLTVDAGLFKPRAVIGNYVWVDSNNNGVQDANEPSASGIVVTLLDGSGNAVAIAVTDANGKYLFPNVAPGSYSISFSNLPTGTSFTTSNSGGDDAVDSDVIGTTITGIVVTTLTNNLSFDAGLINFIILPIRLVSFVANPKANTVELTWVVATETNVANYEIEYSANGTNYNSIGSKTATGSRNYNLIHTTPKQGLNYYRLKIIDKDGKVSYSEVRTVNFGGVEGSVKVYPTPAVSNVNVTLTSNMINQPATISILSIDGRLAHQQATTALSQTETINVSKLASGKYIVRIVTNKQVVNVQIEVLR